MGLPLLEVFFLSKRHPDQTKRRIVVGVAAWKFQKPREPDIHHK